MFSRLALLAFAGILAFSPVAHVSMTNERGVLFVHVRVNGVGPLLFVFDPGGADLITTYARERLDGKPARTIAVGEATMDGSFPVLSGDPAQLDPQHDASFGTIAGSIGPLLLKHYVIRIDYANATLALISFDSVSQRASATPLPLRLDRFGMPTVAASADGFTGRFEVDVRAPVSVLFTPFVERHDFNARYARRPVFKQSPLGKQYALSDLTIGPYAVRDSRVWLSHASSGKFASGEVAGLIGNDVLSRFVVTLDYPRRMLYLER